MTNRTAVITGGTSGLGEVTALTLAKEGWQVFIVGRDAERGKQVMDRSEGRVTFYAADLFSLHDVARLAKVLVEAAPRIDLLVNNAGGSFSRDVRTVDGLERTFALNVAAPFLLTEGLLPALAAAKGRVVNVVTGVPNGAKASLEQLAGEKAGPGMGQYIRAKLALIAVTREQARRFAAQGVTVVALHPGIIPGTRFGNELPAAIRTVANGMAKLFGFGSTPEQAAERYLKVGTGPVEDGGFYREGKLSPPPPFVAQGAFAEALWARLAQLAPRAAN